MSNCPNCPTSRENGHLQPTSGTPWDSKGQFDTLFRPFWDSTLSDFGQNKQIPEVCRMCPSPQHKPGTVPTVPNGTVNGFLLSHSQLGLGFCSISFDGADILLLVQLLRRSL